MEEKQQQQQQQRQPLQLSTVVLLWRQSLEFVVDVIDLSTENDPYSSQGDLMIYVRNAQQKGPRRKLKTKKGPYWKSAGSSEHRVLKEVWKEWLDDRLEYIMDEVEEVDDRRQGKDVAYVDLQHMLKERDDKNDSWRASSSSKQRGAAWHRREQDHRNDAKRKLTATHALMLRDVAHRWLDIEVLEKDTAIEKEKKLSSIQIPPVKIEVDAYSENNNHQDDDELNFVLHLNQPETKYESKSNTFETKSAPSSAPLKQTDNDTDGVHFTTPRFAKPGADGFHHRNVLFRAKRRALDNDLAMVGPLCDGAKAAAAQAHTTINRACLTQEELEKERMLVLEKLEQERREAGYTIEERLTIFLCSCSMSKNEKILIKNDIGYADLPTLNDQSLLQMNLIGMRNMLARRRFLQAIVAEFGEVVVEKKKEDLVLMDSSEEEAEEDNDDGDDEEEEEEEEEEEDHRY